MKASKIKEWKHEENIQHNGQRRLEGWHCRERRHEEDQRSMKIMQPGRGRAKIVIGKNYRQIWGTLLLLGPVAAIFWWYHSYTERPSDRAHVWYNFPQIKAQYDSGQSVTELMNQVISSDRSQWVIPSYVSIPFENEEMPNLETGGRSTHKQPESPAPPQL